ncbi:MAG: class I SAM-dependent methyltransferase [Pseudomonadota bacterium]
MKLFRRFALGLATLLGIPRGYFIPYRWAGAIEQAATPAAIASTQSIFDTANQNFSAIHDAIAGNAAFFAKIGHAPAPAPRWAQDWFAPLDAAALYSIIAMHAPKQILEVGSGHSTRFAQQAVHDAQLQAKIIAIDPAPRADIRALSDVTVINAPLHSDHAQYFHSLRRNDLLFIDSSHIMMPGTDVDLLFNCLLWQVPAGVLIHIHDIFLPDPYPKDWQWRGYNEQNALAIILRHPRCDLLWASRYITQYHAKDIRLDAGIMAMSDNPATSLWLKFR